MDAVSETVNWSQVAAAAFETKLAEIALRKKEKTMTDIVQRLRASRVTSISADQKRGEKLGRHWAEHVAPWRELKELAENWEDLDRDPFAPDSADWREMNFADAETCGASIVLSLFVPDEELHDRFQESLETLFGTTNETEVSLDVANGFVQGAIGVYTQVVDEVEG